MKAISVLLFLLRKPLSTILAPGYDSNCITCFLSVIYNFVIQHCSYHRHPIHLIRARRCAIQQK